MGATRGVWRFGLLVVAAAALALGGAACSGGGSGGGSSKSNGGAASGGAQGGGGAPAIPFALIASAPAGVESGHVELDYLLIDSAGASADIQVDYSLDGGVTWLPATEGIASDGTVALASAPDPGASHRFVWDSFGDLGEVFVAGVMARVSMVSVTGALEDIVGPFPLNNERATSAVLLSRGPYVQDALPNSAVIVWTTTVPTSGHVEWGRTEALGSTAFTTAPGTQHEVELTGLNPGETYHYRVVSNGQPLAPTARFRSANAQWQTSFEFIVFGDSGKGSQDQWDVAQGMEHATADFVLHVGDIVYPSGEQSLYDARFFSPYRKMLAGAPVFPAMGNHDVKELFGQAFLDNFHLPTGSGSEKYYTFTYGDARFICLDTSYPLLILPGLPQHQWFIDTLTRSTETWTFIFFHHPPYSSGSHGSDAITRQAIAPFCEGEGVDMVFSGHDHHYERTSHRRDFGGPGPGPVYVLTGAAGARSGSPSPGRSFTAAKSYEAHYTHVAVSGRTLHLEARTADGTVIDAYDLVK
jgi:predicted phosphodiesterase